MRIISLLNAQESMELTGAMASYLITNLMVKPGKPGWRHQHNPRSPRWSDLGTCTGRRTTAAVFPHHEQVFQVYERQGRAGAGAPRPAVPGACTPGPPVALGSRTAGPAAQRTTARSRSGYRGTAPLSRSGCWRTNARARSGYRRTNGRTRGSCVAGRTPGVAASG